MAGIVVLLLAASLHAAPRAEDFHRDWFEDLYNVGSRILAMGSKQKEPNGKLEIWSIRQGFSFTENKTTELEQELAKALSQSQALQADFSVNDQRFFDIHKDVLKSLGDYALMRDYEEKARDLAARAGGANWIGLVPYEPYDPKYDDPVYATLREIIGRYRLKTIKHTFKVGKKTYAQGMIAENSSLTILVHAWSKLEEAERMYEGERSPPELRLGMTGEEVEAALGKPATVIRLPGKTVYKYSDLVVEFTDGKVSDIKY